MNLSCSLFGTTVAIPVCPASARQLEQALWLADLEERANALAETMRLDPGLVCLFASEWLPADRNSLAPVAGLAARAAESLSSLLATAWMEPEAEAAAEQTAALAKLAATGVARAELIRRLADEHGCQEPDGFELSALMLGAAEWVDPPQLEISDWLSSELGLPDVAAFAAVAESLLAESLMAAPEPAGSVASDLVRPQQPGKMKTPVRHSARLLNGCADLLERVTQHWRQEDSMAGADLLRLARRLAPLEALQTDFRQQLETEKLLAMKELAYGAGHEINNPLANISVRAQTLIKQEQDPERKRMLAAINGQVYRAHEMIADLMLFAQPPQLSPSETTLLPLLERVAEGLRPDAARQQSEIVVLPASTPVSAYVDALQLSLALHAMVLNALEAMGQGGRIELQVATRQAPRGKLWAEIRVRDNGPGIDEHVRQHLFDPFFSGREAGRGLGFGLSKCWRIVTAHGGRIDVESSPGCGALFILALPA